MTIKEFYEWAVTQNVENAEVHIGYRDDGGHYYGYDFLEKQEIYIEDNGKIVEI